jgi:hypothetical protein
VVVLHMCFVSDVFDDLLVVFAFGFLILGLFFPLQMAIWVCWLLDEFPVEPEHYLCVALS